MWIRVSEKTPFTRKWLNFLRVSQNKAELFQLIAAICNTEVSLSHTQVAFAIESTLLHSSEAINKQQLLPCNHGEADTRIFCT